MSIESDRHTSVASQAGLLAAFVCNFVAAAIAAAEASAAATASARPRSARARSERSLVICTVRAHQARRRPSSLLRSWAGCQCQHPAHASLIIFKLPWGLPGSLVPDGLTGYKHGLARGYSSTSRGPAVTQGGPGMNANLLMCLRDGPPGCPELRSVFWPRARSRP